MISLEADNRALITSAKYTYLKTNYSSGVTSISVLNATDTQFDNNVFLLLSNFGAEDAEIVQISSLDYNAGEIQLTAPTLFSHSESTRVTVMPYDEIRFYWTSVPTFDIGTATPLTGYINIQPSDWYTTYDDIVNFTGYGWYFYRNSYINTTNPPLGLSQVSSAIPYVGFESNQTADIVRDFFSMLSNKELKLVTRDDALTWASEAYSRMRNKLNLTNIEYTASEVMALPIIAGQTEYNLPDDFDHLISFIQGVNPTIPGSWGGNKKDIDFIPLTEAYTFNGIGPRYYIRKFKLGILPTPSTDTTYYYMYQQKANRLSLNTDVVDLPNGGEYVIKDYMLYRAYQKFQNPQFKSFFESFTAGLNDMVIAAVKRDANLDTWGIQRQSNV
jgi:hypothetical protein